MIVMRHLVLTFALLLGLIGVVLCPSALADVAGERDADQRLPKQVIQAEYNADQPEQVVQLQSGLNLLLTDEVRINGERIGYFLIDTGSNKTVVSPAVAESLGLAIQGGLEINGQPRGATHATSRVSVGPLTVRHLPIGSIDLKHMQVFAKPVVGILGSDVLSQLPFTIDFRAQTLTLHDPVRFEPPVDGWSSKIVSVNRFREAGKVDPDRSAGSPAIAGRINGKQALLMLDTGKNGMLRVSEKMAKQQPEQIGRLVIDLNKPINFDGDDQGQARHFEIDQLQLFGQTSENVAGGRTRLDQAEAGIKDFDAIVGTMLLRDYRLTFDMKAKRLWVDQVSVDSAVAVKKKENGGVDRPSIAGVAPLIDAVRFDDAALLKALIADGASVTVTDALGNNALHAAMYRQRTTCLEILLKHAQCPSPNQRSNASVTPMMLAARLNQHTHADLLIQHGAAVDLLSLTGWGAMHYAADAGHLGLVELLIQHRAKVDLAFQDGPSPILLAVSKGHLEVAQRLAKHGADLQFRAQTGETLMHAAAFSGDEAVLEWGIDSLPVDRIDRPMRNGVTPLMMAADRGHAELVARLIEAGADLKARAVKNREFGSESVIHFAAVNGHTAVLKALLERGVMVDEPSGAKLTPLILAAAGGHTRSLVFLLDKGARINAVDVHQMSALHYAAKYSRTPTVAALIAAGAELSADGHQGMRPLDLAVLIGDEDTARLLVNAGVDPRRTGRHGRSSIGLAKARGHTRLAELLAQWADVPE